jgi:hypothetical protein
MRFSTKLTNPLYVTHEEEASRKRQKVETPLTSYSPAPAVKKAPKLHMGTKRGGSLNLATSALVASIAIADNLFVKDSTRHSLAEVKSDIIPMSNFNDSDFTV